MVEESTPHLIVLEVMIPHLDGYEFCKLYVKTEVPILFLSSKEEEMDQILGLGIGEDDFISKSIKYEINCKSNGDSVYRIINGG
ncbi:response regulator [Virgibacillus pantothenticus]|uniref:response regulator n=1 Tax=Virgibacillus pantothenticus TaxID=1473 RepID=UPI0009866F72|nr:response regulator [Virgibacillus pantothenticus]